jgi:hypothetical protein
LFQITAMQFNLLYKHRLTFETLNAMHLTQKYRDCIFYPALDCLLEITEMTGLPPPRQHLFPTSIQLFFPPTHIEWSELQTQYY